MQKVGLKFDMYNHMLMIIIMRFIGKGWKFDIKKLVFDHFLEENDLEVTHNV